jgi:6-phosphogluconolactonase
MNFILTEDFKKELLNLFIPYDGHPLNLMISGGSLLDVLDNPKYKDLDSSKWKIWYADERCHPSYLNYTGSLKFLSHLTPEKVNRIQYEASDPVNEYASTLEKIDICLLGIGNDGHICSLFPELNYLDASENVIKVFNPTIISPDRITVTINFINKMVDNLYFVIPPGQDGKIKRLVKPHERICKRSKKEYVSIIDKRFNIEN